MGVEFLAERGLLSDDERGIVERSHYPALESLDGEGLRDLARLLRARRARARDILHNQRRAKRGKAGVAARPVANEPGDGPGLSDKKQVFARALKRVNGRIAALEAERKREQAVARMREALARKEASQASHPRSGDAAGGGMALARRAAKRPGIVQGGRVGSVSKANKRRQAKRDAA